MSQQVVVLLLGSNLGDSKKNLNDAIALLEQHDVKVLKKSNIITTKPVEFVSFNNFRNIALSVKTHLSPVKLLLEIKKIEREMGRLQDSGFSGNYEDRVIDIDIVRYGNIDFHCKKLEIPHKKHLYERGFSAELLKQINEH